MDEISEIMESLSSELKRGTLVLSVLTSLRQKQYGYSLQQVLDKQGMPIDQNTLYPLLRRLEKQGLLDSDWLIEDARPRRYYVLSDKGKIVLYRLSDEWEKMTQALDKLLYYKKN